MRIGAVWIAAAFVCSALPAFACECVSFDSGTCPRPPDTGDLVAVGTVVSKDIIRSAPPSVTSNGDLSNRPTTRRTGSGSPPIPRTIIRVTLSVAESFRGNPGKMAVVETDTSDCAYPFELGGTYLVFAEKIQGALRVNKCSATRPARMAVTTIQQLRARRDGTALPDLFGFAGTHAIDTSELGWEQIEPVPGLTVTAELNGTVYRTQTGEDGSYAFRGVPRGYYHLSIAPPAGRVVLPAQTGTESGPHTCPMQFEVFYDGRIRGTVTGPDGQPANGFVMAQYQEPDKRGFAPIGAPVRNGSFEILRLAPGRYRLAFSDGQSHRLIYYPGTIDSSEATVIQLGDGAHVDGLAFRVF